MTIAHAIGGMLPTPLFKFLKPKWTYYRLYQGFRKIGGRLHYDRRLRCWIAARPMADGRMMPVCVHSYREFRRIYQFGEVGEIDVVWKWLHWIKDCRMLYDIGSANGLEGFLSNHLHGCQVAFVEPYTPSIVTILKTIETTQKKAGFRGGFEVVHAGCDEREGYSRLYMHEAPIPGETLNTFDAAEGYADPEGRPRGDVTVAQWVKGVSLDGLAYEHNLPEPSHVKIDVDGFEGRVMKGARRLLEAGVVDSWVIEITGEELIEKIDRTMASSGYEKVGSYEHYPGYTPATFDFVYVKPELAESWNSFHVAKPVNGNAVDPRAD